MRHTTTRFAHGDVPIIVTKSGQFEASTPQGVVTRRTLSALRKALDEITPFKPFKALAYRWSSQLGRHDIIEVQITGTTGKGGKRQWVADNYSHHPYVYTNTPANKKRIRAWVAEKRRCDAARNRLWKVEGTAKAAVEKLIP
jgi:hypothetical protein